MKFLILCNLGNVRSVALRRQITKKCGPIRHKDYDYINKLPHEAIAMGAHNTTSKTLVLLIDWSDKVIDMSDPFEVIQDNLKLLAGPKYLRRYIGKDIWYTPKHPKLIEITKALANDLT